jgi:Protein of unknown function (DUF3313)
MTTLATKTAFVATFCALAATVTAAEKRHAAPAVPLLPVVAQVVTAPSGTVYDRLLIDDIEVAYDESSSYRNLKPEHLARLNAAVVEAIRRAVGTRYTLTGEPGPGVLRVHPAIVDLHAERKAKHFWSYTPFGFVKGRIDTATGRNFVLESATVEVQLFDSVTGRELAAAADLTADSATEELSFRTLIAKVGEWTVRLVGQVEQRTELSASAR